MPKTYSRDLNRVSPLRLAQFISGAIAALVFSPIASTQINETTAQEIQTGYFNIGDTAKVLVKDVDLITGEYLVNDQGYIDLPLIGLVKAQDLTSLDLETILVRLYSVDYLNNPMISVSLLSSAPDPTAAQNESNWLTIEEFADTTAQNNVSVSIGKFLLDGQVKAPRLYYMEEVQTLSAIINRAGGLLKDADPDEIIVSRTQSEIKRKNYSVAYSKVSSSALEDPLIYPGDIIFIKNKTDQYTLDKINKIISSLETQLNTAK